MRIVNFWQRRPVALVLMAFSSLGALHAAGYAAANTNSRISVVGDTIKKGTDSTQFGKPRKTISMLPASADNKLVLLGMSNYSGSDLDNRFLLLSALVRSGDLEKTTHWYLPMQPYGISLLKQYIITGDTFASVSLKGIYDGNVQQLDTLLKELRGIYLKNPSLVNNWVIKTCYPTLNDSERGYALALKRYMDKPEIPAAIRYQVESLLANAMFSYYQILNDVDDGDEYINFNMGYLDANFDYYETFKAFSNSFDSLKPQFKSWLPAAEFTEVSDLMDYYKWSIKTNVRENDGLFYFLDSRKELVKEIAGLVSSTAPNKVIVMAPTEELILNDKKIGFVSILRGLLDRGVSKNKISRLLTFSGSLEDKVVIQKYPSEDIVFERLVETILENSSLSVDEDGGYFADYFLFDIKSKDPKDSSLIKAKSTIYQEYKKYVFPEFELTNSFLAFPARDGDNSGIATFAVMPGQVVDAAMDTAISKTGWDSEADNYGWGINSEDYENKNYQWNEIPKIRHATAQIEFAYSYMVNSSVSKFANNLTTLLSENGLGTINTSLGYRGVALNLLSSGEKNNAKTYQFWGLRGGEYQTSNKYLTGFHFGYLQGVSYAMDKKRRIYMNVLSYLEGFDTKLSFPTGAVSGSLNSPLTGKTFKTVGTVYGMMLGTTLRLNRLFVHANIGYGWDLSKGEWTMNKSIVSGIAAFKYTGVNYGIQAGYKFGLFKNESESDWSLTDSTATEVVYETVTVGNRITKDKKSTKTYRNPKYYLKPTATHEVAPIIQTKWGISKLHPSANATQSNLQDTAIVSPAIEEKRVDFNPKGYHYDFNDAELSSPAVKMMSERAKKARIVLAGENHRYVKFNSRSEFRWMKMLYENAGYRNYVLELSPTRAVFLERYVCKGDTVAKKIIQSTSSARFMVLFDSLAVWQMGLPESERIKIYGLDVERFADMTIMWLNEIVMRRDEMLSDKNNNLKGVPASIEVGLRAINHMGSIYYYGGQRDYLESLEDFNSELIESDTSLTMSSVGKVDTAGTAMLKLEPSGVSSIHQLDDWRRLDFNRVSFNEDPSTIELYRYIDSNKAEFKAWLGPLWPEFSDAFARLREVYEWERRDEQAQQYQWREETMYRNMVNLLDKYPNSKFFGQFGRCHIGLSKQQQDCGWFEYNSILARLRTRYFKNDSSVMNIGIFYKENEDDVDDISSSDLLHNQKIRDEVTKLYVNTEENTMVYNLEELGDYKSEMRKKFNFVVVIGQEQDDDGDYDYSFSSDNEVSGDNSEVNMGVYMGYGLGANLGSLYGETMVNYLLTQEAIDLRNPTTNSFNTLFLGYRGKHVSMQYGLGYKLKNRQLFSDGLSFIDGNMTLHTMTMYLHNSNVNNRKLLHYGLGMGYTFTKQRLTYQKVEPQLISVTGPVELVSYRGMPTASVVFGILKDNVGLDIEAGYRMQMNNAAWEYRGSRMPFATAGYSEGIATDLLKLPFATINLRIIIEGTQPVYKVNKSDSEDTD